MTKVEVINALESGDVNSIINFTLANNPDALITSVKVAGFPDVKTYDDAKRVLLTMFSQGNYADFLKVLNAVPYLNNVDNYTGGMQDWFLGKLSPEQRAQFQATNVAQRLADGVTTDPVSSPTEPSKGNLWLTIGSGVVGIVGSIFGAKQSVADATLANQVALAQAAQTKKIWTIAAVVMGSLVILFVGLYLVRKKDK